MKKSTIPLISRFVLVLALLSTFFTSMAYDFEVDGIYYNKTSNNTVEVTYKDKNYSTYQGSVTIPSTVLNDNKVYHVTSIGDSAFYEIFYGSPLEEECDYSALSKVILPESISLIGRDAFWGCCYLSEVDCLALEPPQFVNDKAFITHSLADNNSYFYELIGSYCEWCFDDILSSELPNIYSYNEFNYQSYESLMQYSTLFVQPESYEKYLNDASWSRFFNIIVPFGAEKSECPIISDVLSVENGDLSFCNVSSLEDDTRLFLYYRFGRMKTYLTTPIKESNHVYRNDLLNLFDRCPYNLDVYAFAVTKGKLPSEITTLHIDIIGFDGSNEPIILYTDTINELVVNKYDEIIDGACFNYIDDKSMSIVSDEYAHWYLCDDYYYFETNENIVHDLTYTRRGCYNGNVVIPSSVYSHGKKYDVTTIGSGAFGYHNWNDNDYAECSNMTSVTIPNTIKKIELDFYSYSPFNFYGMPLKDINITGVGEWSAGGLDALTEHLYIASGITAVPGLKVNPREVYCYASVPPTCDENTFMDYTGTLHVPESSLAAYFTAPYWCNFLNIVGGAVELTELTLNVDSAELMVGKQLSLNATLEPANASADNIAWTSSDENVASVVDGIVTAKAKGECDIIVTCLDKRAVCHVIVNEILPTDIALNEESIMMELDSTYTLIASITPSNSTFTTVNWSSSNSAVATVNADGVVTAVGVGECDIIASCRELSAVCHVKVLEKFVYITIDQHRASLLPNHILTLTPTVTPIATVLVVSSSNPSVAAARLADGKVQVVGVAPGSAVIKVSSADGNAFADSCVVNVYTELGDVNGDGFVKINDVTVLIDYLLDSTMSQFDIGKADLNCDGKINISDVTLLIDCLLGGYVPMSTRETFTVNGVSFTMIRVPAGTFMMGATQEQGDDATEREKPAHEVTLTSSYLLGETEVTQRLWLAVMGTNPSKHMGDLDKPVENVTWPDCQEFITHLNALTGQNFRLPSEAEWEYAARGANKSRGYKYSGSDNIDEVGWVTGTTTHPVGSLVPNEMNLYDMSGNVDEWIQDYWYTYSSASQTDPTGPESGTSHVYRGGSWYGGPTASRVSCRMYRSETFQRGTLGLRLAL